jgi:hypothetical protein
MTDSIRAEGEKLVHEDLCSSLCLLLKLRSHISNLSCVLLQSADFKFVMTHQCCLNL